MAVLWVKDQTGAWTPAAAPGPTGPTGPIGITGPTGPQGPIDIAQEEVVVGPTQPDPTTQPLAELWYDPNLPPPTYPGIPRGGTTDQTLTIIDTNGTTGWRGPNLKLTGGTMTSDLTITGDLTTQDTLTTPNAAGNVWFNNNISAANVIDRTGYEWEEWEELETWLAGGWESDGTRGPCNIWRNRHTVLVCMDLQRPGARGKYEWMYVFDLNHPIPDRFRPATMLWDTFTGVEINWQGPLFQVKIQPDGQIWLWAAGAPLWQDNTHVPIYFCYPAKSI